MKFSSCLLLFFMFVLTVSCEEILMEEDISASKLEILAPRDSTLLKGTSVSFHWSNVEGATSYGLQIATPNFDIPRQIVIDTETEENSFVEDLVEGQYEWRVRALNSGYATRYESANFTVQKNGEFSSSRVVLLSPEDGHVTNEENINLQWEEFQDATLYRVQVLEAGMVIKEETTASTELPVIFPQGEFTWKVRAENDTQNTFYTARTITIDTVSPAIPNLVKPADAATLATESVSFEWKREDVGGSAELDSLFIYKDVGLKELVEKEQVSVSYNTTLNRQQTYYWFMRSYDKAGNQSEKSAVFSFTIN